MDDGVYESGPGWTLMPILLAEVVVTAAWRLYGGLDLLWWMRR